MEINPFTITIDSKEIQDLQDRIRLTRWSSALAAAGWSLGMDSDYLKALAH